jgi:predicted phosphodiesterase
MNLDSSREYIIIGDIHGCIDEFKLLLQKQNFQIDSRGYITSAPKSIILIGDFIDKAKESKLKETIEFIHKNYLYLNRDKKIFYLIVGNHEKRVYEYITNSPTLKGKKNVKEEEEKYYNTSLLLKKDIKLKDKFLFLYRESNIWLRYKYKKLNVVISHAPCKEKYLAKNDEISKAKMVKCESRSKNRGVSLDRLLYYLIEEAKDSSNIHIFGHLSQPNIRRYKNKICIDTACIYGNTLSCAILKEDKITFDSVPFLNLQKPANQNYNLLFDF